MTAAEALTNSQRTESIGHLADRDGYEYMIGPDGAIYRAPLYNPMGLNGYRQGARFECTASSWRHISKHVLDL